MVGYKDQTIDPTTDPAATTVNWREPVLDRPRADADRRAVHGRDEVTARYYPYVVNNSSNWVYAGTGLARAGTAFPGSSDMRPIGRSPTSPAPVTITGSHALLSHSPFTNASNASELLRTRPSIRPTAARGCSGSGHDGLELGGWTTMAVRGALDTRIQLSDGQHPEPVHRTVACTERGVDARLRQS